MVAKYPSNNSDKIKASRIRHGRTKHVQVPVALLVEMLLQCNTSTLKKAQMRLGPKAVEALLDGTQ